MVQLKVIFRTLIFLMASFIVALVLFYFFSSDNYTEEYLRLHNLTRADIADDYGFGLGAVGDAVAQFFIFLIISLVSVFGLFWYFWWRTNPIFKTVNKVEQS